MVNKKASRRMQRHAAPADRNLSLRLTFDGNNVLAAVHSAKVPLETFEADRITVVGHKAGWVAVIADQLNEAGQPLVRMELRASIDNFASFISTVRLRFVAPFEEWWAKTENLTNGEMKPTPAANADIPVETRNVRRWQIGRLSHMGFETEFAFHSFSVGDLLTARESVNGQGTVNIGMADVLRVTCSTTVLPEFLAACDRIIVKPKK